MSRTIYYKDDSFSFEYEIDDTIASLHCIVSKWSHTVLKNAYLAFGRFMNERERMGITKVITISPNPKFAKLFGGTTLNTLVLNGKETEIILWQN